MPISNVSSLYQRINKGAEGGLEFARIMNQLILSESSNEGFYFKTCSDAAGDFKGVDGIIASGLVQKGLQYKFIPTPFSSNHKSEIKSSLLNAITKFPEMDQWILVIPDEPNQHDVAWLENISNEYSMQVAHWGHTKITSLMLKHKHIGNQYYPEFNSSIVRRSSDPTEEDKNSYFGKFIDPDINIALLLMKAQPTLSDCKAIFTKEYYKEACDMYYYLYRDILEASADDSKIKRKDIFEIRSSTYADIVNKKHVLAGGMSRMQEKFNALNNDTRFYSVQFKEKDAEYGISFEVWCFLNGRWVFFPKPFRVIDSIISLRKNKDLNLMIKILKWLGIHKKLRNEYRNQPILAVNHIVYKLLDKDS